MHSSISTWRYILKRLLSGLLTLGIVSVIAFSLSRIMPGDPVEGILIRDGYNPAGEGSVAYYEEYDRLKVQLGLDLPVFYWSISVRQEPPHHPNITYHGNQNQYHQWLTGMLQGNLGTSMKSGRKVTALIGNALQWTLTLSLLTLTIVFAIGIPLGMYLHHRRHSVVQHFLYIIYSLPTFWIAILLLTFFTTVEYGEWTDILPSPGLWQVDTTPIQAIQSAGYRLVIPVLVITLHDLAYVTSIIQSRADHESASPYLLTAKSKGLTKAQITKNHLLPNTLIPVITILIDAIPRSLAGLVIIEVICNLPGMGRLLYGSIIEQDWTVVLSIIMLVCVVTTLAYLIGDLLYKWVNPKVELI